MKQYIVIKSDGSTEPLQPEKYLKPCEWACEGVAQVSASTLAFRAYDRMYDKISTRDLHFNLIKTAVDMVEESANYDKVAARLLNFYLRKSVYGSYTVPHLHEIVVKNTKENKYTPDLLDSYSTKEFEALNVMLRHERDNDFSYAAMSQLKAKYLTQDRSTGVIYETPQVTYLLIAATLFMSESEETRMDKIKEYYDSQSLHKHSIPTPIAAGVRTLVKQFSSCVLIPAGDGLDPICAAGNSIVKYVSKKAGVGLNVGHIRALGSRVGDGSVMHTGLIPFIKKFKGDLKSCSQGGVRGAAATVYYPWWHMEFPELIVLKNNAGTEETRERHMDYAVEFTRLIFDRFKEKGNVTLFSPHEVPEVKDAFYRGDNEAFKIAYEAAENNPNIRKRVISATEWVFNFVTERKKTGRIYAAFLDNMNAQGSFVDLPSGAYLSSNLCLEITLPIKEFETETSEDGLIALCTLSSVNWGKVNKIEDLEKPCRISVRALDNLLDYQEYPSIHAERFTKLYRALGVGIVGLAHFLAKRGLKYDKKSLKVVDEYMEAMAYYLIDESVRIAEEKGPCDGYKHTCYGNGVFPWERRKSNVDKLVTHSLRFDWEELRERMIKFGIRNSTLMAIAPTESSSQLLNETNGIEPPKAAIQEKSSKDGKLKQVVPEYGKLKNKYDYAWDQKSPKGYLSVVAVLQKWVDQAISANTSYDPHLYPDSKIPASVLVSDLLFAYESGAKTLYYDNTKDSKDEVVEDTVVEIQDEDCEACRI